MLYEENIEGTAFIIGRFQPITNAHYEIIEDARKKYSKTFVVVVNPNPTPKSKKYTKSGEFRKPYLDKMKKNPFSLRYRTKLIHKAFGGKLPMQNIISAKSGFIPAVVDKIHRYVSSKRAKSKCR